MLLSWQCTHARMHALVLTRPPACGSAALLCSTAQRALHEHVHVQPLQAHADAQQRQPAQGLDAPVHDEPHGGGIRPAGHQAAGRRGCGSSRAAGGAAARRRAGAAPQLQLRGGWRLGNRRGTSCLLACVCCQPTAMHNVLCYLPAVQELQRGGAEATPHAGAGAATPSGPGSPTRMQRGAGAGAAAGGASAKPRDDGNGGSDLPGFSQGLIIAAACFLLRQAQPDAVGAAAAAATAALPAAGAAIPIDPVRGSSGWLGWLAWLAAVLVLACMGFAANE